MNLDVCPALTKHDAADGSAIYAKFSSEAGAYTVSRFVGTDVQDVLFGKFRAPVAGTRSATFWAVSKNIYGVPHVTGVGGDFEIADGIVKCVAVYVVNASISRNRSDECLNHHAMYANSFGDAKFAELHAKVIAGHDRFDDSASSTLACSDATDFSKTTDLVEVFIPNDCTPIFHREIVP